MNKTVFIDFLGYRPNCNFLIIDAADGKTWLGMQPDEILLKKAIKQCGYNLIANPRFSNFPAHIEMVKELNS